MITIDGENYRELRCSKCRKLICYENVRGKMCYICPRCDEINYFNFTSLRDWKKTGRIKVLKIVNEGGE